MSNPSPNALSVAKRVFSGDLYSEGPTPARVWGDQWLRVSEKVLKGLNHKLTNRVAALEAVVNVLDPREGPDPELLGTLTSEIAKLHELLNLFRLMPAEPFAAPEAVRLQDVVPRVLQLHRHHTDLKEIPVDVEEDPDAAPVLVRQSALLRCLLVLLEGGAGNALRADSFVPLRLRYEEVSGYVEITLEAPAAPGQLLFSGEGSLVHAVRSALAHAHGTVDQELDTSPSGQIVRYSLRIATLAESRRLERESAL